MQTVKELIEELQTHNLPHMADGSFNITAAQHAAILSLLSQQSEGVESDEAWAIKYANDFGDDILDEEWLNIKHAALAGCQHVRQQLSQPEAAPIKLGDRFLTQEEFNRMYTHYSELCDKEDTNSWFENQFYMLKAQQQQGMRWVKASERLPKVTSDYQFLVVKYKHGFEIAELTDEAKEGEPEDKTLWIKGQHYSGLQLQLIYWLDESLSQQQQQRSYSEEEVLELLDKYGYYCLQQGKAKVTQIEAITEPKEWLTKYNQLNK